MAHRGKIWEYHICRDYSSCPTIMDYPALRYKMSPSELSGAFDLSALPDPWISEPGLYNVGDGRIDWVWEYEAPEGPIKLRFWTQVDTGLGEFRNVQQLQVWTTLNGWSNSIGRTSVVDTWERLQRTGQTQTNIGPLLQWGPGCNVYAARWSDVENI